MSHFQAVMSEVCWGLAGTPFGPGVCVEVNTPAHSVSLEQSRASRSYLHLGNGIAFKVSGWGTELLIVSLGLLKSLIWCVHSCLFYS